MNVNGFKILSTPDDKRYVEVECPLCKNIVIRRMAVLKRAKSCGCSWRTPGVSRRLQHSYNSMKQRCLNVKHPHHKYYADVKICPEWLNDSKAFYKWALANGYQDHLTLDRIDGTKGYEAGNCRWADAKTQCRNKANNVVRLEIARAIQQEPPRSPLKDLCIKYGLARSTLKRIKYKQTWK